MIVNRSMTLKFHYTNKLGYFWADYLAIYMPQIGESCKLCVIIDVSFERTDISITAIFRISEVLQVKVLTSDFSTN